MNVSFKSYQVFDEHSAPLHRSSSLSRIRSYIHTLVANMHNNENNCIYAYLHALDFIRQKSVPIWLIDSPSDDDSNPLQLIAP